MVVLLFAAFVLFVENVPRYVFIVVKYPLNVVSNADKFVFTYVFN